MSGLLPFVIGGLAGGSIYAIAALGLVTTYKTTGFFNFAHGSIAAGSAYIFYDLWQRSGLPWPVAFILVVGVFAPLSGVALDLLITSLAGVSTAAKITASVGLLVAVDGLLTLRYGPVTLDLPAFLPTKTYKVGSVNVGADQIISMLVALGASGGLALFFARTRTGRAMRAGVDNKELLSLTGTRPRRVQLTACIIGACFASISGLLIAPSLGLDALLLTLLVVQAFGAAAIGAFNSLPLTYLGGLVVGVGAAISRKYVGRLPFLAGFPPSFPFIVLFVVLVALPADRLPLVPETSTSPRLAGGKPSSRVSIVATLAGTMTLCAVPLFASTRLPAFNSGLAYVLVFASLGLLVHTSGQVSLCHLAFAAVGAAVFAHAQAAGVPWALALVLSGLLAIPVGAVVAIPAFRLSRLYLALATLGFGILLERFAYGTNIMFGLRGSRVIARPAFARSDAAYYYVSLAVILAGVALTTAIQRARIGRLLRALADSPIGLSAVGVDVNVLRLLVLCVSAFLAGIAGALLGGANGSVSSVNFSSFTSLLLLPVLLLAGPRRVVGPIVAAFSLSVLPIYIPGATFARVQPVLFGAAAVMVAVVGSGHAPRIDLSRWLSSRALRRTGHSLVQERTARRESVLIEAR